jgi:hypothetical protein
MLSEGSAVVLKRFAIFRRRDQYRRAILGQVGVGRISRALAEWTSQRSITPDSSKDESVVG